MNDYIEGFKEILRTACMALIPLIVMDLQSNKFEWKNWLIATIIATLSGIDKYLHEQKRGVMKNGLTGF